MFKILIHDPRQKKINKPLIHENSFLVVLFSTIRVWASQDISLGRAKTSVAYGTNLIRCWSKW